MPDDQALSDTSAFKTEPIGEVNHPPLVETVLDLDEIMTEGRRPERTARFCIRPDIEADIDELTYRLAELVDEDGKPLDGGDDESLVDGGEHLDIARQIEEKRAEMRKWMRSVRVRAMSKDEWLAFHTSMRDDKTDDGYKPAFWIQLIVKCAIKPAFTDADVKKLRKQLGQPAVDMIGLACFRANTASGVDVPKSQLSSLVLKPRERD